MCEHNWSEILEDEWVHLFIHTLDTVPRNWYTETELCRGTITWPVMIDNFELTFTFESEYPSIDQALDVIKTKIFEDCTLSVHTQPEWAIQLEDALDAITSKQNQRMSIRGILGSKMGLLRKIIK